MPPEGAQAALVAFLHTFISDGFYSPDVIAAATKYGLATQQQFDDWRLARQMTTCTPLASTPQEVFASRSFILTP